jgi:hypothetical protein
MGGYRRYIVRVLAGYIWLFPMGMLTAVSLLHILKLADSGRQKKFTMLGYLIGYPLAFMGLAITSFKRSIVGDNLLGSFFLIAGCLLGFLTGRLFDKREKRKEL